MNTRYFVLIVGIVLVACTGAVESQPTALSEPTSTPEPSVTPTEEVATEVPPSPTPAPTDIPPATPTQIPTDTPLPFQFNFDWYENNPILNKGASGEWDNWRVYASNTVLIDDVYHMFFTGAGTDILAIGYAVSSDGLTYTKHNANPIFQSDGVGFDAKGVSDAIPLVDGDTWMLFYSARAEGENLEFWLGGSSIGLTTSSEPTGPWTTGKPVLTVGSRGEWDSAYIVPSNVIDTEDGYRIYYTAGSDPGEVNKMCGMATSQDGVTWTKYDDPSTTEPPFAESDPILVPNTSGSASTGVRCFVLKTDSGWEMFYEGWHPSQIYYDTSPDGINWPKLIKEPILGEERWYPTVLKTDSTYYLYTHNYDEGEQYATIGTIDQP
jgi:predicted GH43/DUF377 family glycosyl hydrolase